MGGDALFYGVRSTSLEVPLRELLHKSLERGWRVVVRAGSLERVESLNDALWLGPDEYFIPHGSGADGFASRQPVYLTEGEENPNGAGVLFLLEGVLGDVSGYERCVSLFDGGDSEMLSLVGEQERVLLDLGYSVRRWEQVGGSWERR